MGDLMEWALRMVQGNKEWREAIPLPLEQESERFFGSLKAMDDFLASDTPCAVGGEVRARTRRRRDHARRSALPCCGGKQVRRSEPRRFLFRRLRSGG